MSAFSAEFVLPFVQQQVANAAVQSHFEIAVRDPVKHGDNMSVSAYTSYKNKQPEVIRRFRDFAWLHSRLREQNRGEPLAFPYPGWGAKNPDFAGSLVRMSSPVGTTFESTGIIACSRGKWYSVTRWSSAGIIVPALPEKNVVQKYQMTTEFIEIRRRALSVYLNKVVRGYWSPFCYLRNIYLSFK